MKTENKRILIVDDEPEALKGYSEFLAPQENPHTRKSSRGAPAQAAPAPGTLPMFEKYELLLAQNGEEAVSIFKTELEAEREISCGFFDVKMEGGMDGLQTIQKIVALDPRVYCTVVTAYHDRSVDEIHQIFGEEFKDHWDYLNKPFTRGEIVQKARQMTSAWSRMRKLEAVQNQLIMSERMAAIGQVAKGVGHEFGNILTRVMGKMELAKVDAKDSEKVKAHLEVGLRALDRAAGILQNLRSFSRPEPKMAPTDVYEAYHQSKVLISHELKVGNIEVEEKIEFKPNFSADAAGLGQVFLNLLINSMHAMPKGGKITVTMAKAKDPHGRTSVLLSFKDTGIGIAAEVLPKIFDYAFTTKGAQGSGLGLSISKEIIENHGGEIEVVSQVGQGAEFKLWFPLF